VCGIVGYIGRRDAVPVLLEGLRSLEYRGYDSAGLAVVHRNRLQVTKTAGRVQELRDRLEDRASTSSGRTAGTTSSGRTAGTKATIGIGHTRWATHGEPNEVNAHPHTDTEGRIAVVHNGIIENAEQLRDALIAGGVKLVSDTDTEALAHMIAAEATEGTSLQDAVRQTLRHVEGTYGLVVLDTRNPNELVVARNGSPIVLGIGESEMFVASDVAALVRYTKQVVYLDDAEVATVHASDFRTAALDERDRRGPGERQAKKPTTVEAEAGDYELGSFENYMRKEIHEQPEALRRALRGRLDERFATAKLGGIDLDARQLRSIRQVKFLGCGSAYYAGQMGAVLTEELARIPSDAEPASEFRYRNPVVDPDTLYVAVSQSGETLDTLMAVQELRRKGGQVIGAVNVVGSAIGRECGHGVFLHAGPEIAVCSTKALTNMAATFALLALLLGRVRDMSSASGQRIVAGMRALPGQIEQVLAAEEQIAQIAHQFAGAEHMFFIGRVRGWPVAREGAQKLKEVSYVHAEAYQAAELKHGPLALINSSMPSLVIVPSDDLVSKNVSTIEQIKARGGLADAVVRVPRGEPELEPLLLNVPLQLLAYHVAAKLGRDIDKPRNLAKSVTVE
jgi:glutamine---fructose-6-phosphate transaminase (isomerizing)